MLFLFDKNGKFLKQYNRYKIKDDYVIGYTAKNEPFYVDIEDYDRIKEYCWYKGTNGYFRTTITKNNKKTTLLLHDFIMNRKSDNRRIVVDHIKGRYSNNDNRKSNLRLVPVFVNNINQPNRKDNTSGVKGVNWNKGINKWVVRISVNNDRKYLGAYDTLEEAKKVREEAEELYYGEYSYKNSINR